MTNDSGALWDLALSISDGEHVDWEAAVGGASGGDERELIRSLQAVLGIAQARAEVPDAGDDDDGPEPVVEPRFGPEESPVRRTPSGADALAKAPQRWLHLEIRELVGSGSYGEVYRAWDTTLNREVALKLLRVEAEPKDDASASQVGSFVLDEGRHLARVRHDNVVTVFGAGEHDGRIGLWMEFLEGHTLEDLLRMHGRFGPREAALIGLDLCHALSAVHGAGLVHRDIKAKNVMRAEEGRIVLMDFGTGREIREDTATAASTLVGTPLYMAPEVLRGESPTAKSDIYSLGTLLFHLLTNRYPFESDTVIGLRHAHIRLEAQLLRDLRPDLPEALVRVVERAIAPDPSARFGSGGQMERALELARQL